MATYIALLRGINVGNNLLKMDRVRAVWAELGFSHVQTYLQSGNVVFGAEGSAANLRAILEKKLAGETRLPVTVIVRTPGEMKQVIADNPFAADPMVDFSKLHVTFLESPCRNDTATKLAGIRSEGDECRVANREIYLYCPNGYGRTRLSNQAIEKVLATKATTRNWNTVNKVHAMALASRENGS